MKKKIEYVINTQPELSQVLQSTDIKLSDKDADDGTDIDIKTNATDNSNTTTTCYFYGNGLTSQDNGKDYFSYHFNNVGSTMAVTDVKGSVVETYNYTPYGELIDGEYREDIPFLYNGQYGVTTDSNGLCYMRARYYNVEIKRFINQDVLLGVLGRVSSLNRYAYVEGNPISYLDPFGLDRWVYEEAHKVAMWVSYAVSVVSVFLPPDLALALGVVAACFDLGIYISEGIQYGFTMNLVYDILASMISNAVLLVSSRIPVSLTCKFIQEELSLVKAYIDLDKGLNPSRYSY